MDRARCGHNLNLCDLFKLQRVSVLGCPIEAAAGTGRVAVGAIRGITRVSYSLRFA